MRLTPANGGHLNFDPVTQIRSTLKDPGNLQNPLQMLCCACRPVYFRTTVEFNSTELTRHCSMHFLLMSTLIESYNGLSRMFSASLFLSG